MKPKPNKYQSPRSVAARYLDGEFGGMSVTAVAEVFRVARPSLGTAIAREKQKRSA